MKIKVLQWNIWVKENPDNIVKELKKINADIVCAQELIQDSKTKFDIAKYIAEKLNYHYFYKTADTWDNRDEKNAQGNVIFSKYPIIDTLHKHIQKPKHNPPDASHEGRVYIETKIKIKKKIMQIGTTHLSYSHKFDIDKQRKEEADVLFEIIKNKNKNYILAGDFNAVPDSYVIKKLEKIFVNAGPDFKEKTWPTKPFNYHGFQENKLNWRIDYIFINNDVKVINSKIIKTLYSDHLPILTEIEI